MLRNIKTRSKILLLVGTTLLLLLLVATVNYRTNVNMQRDLADLYDKYAVPVVVISEVDSAFREIRQFMTEFFVWDDEEYAQELRTDIARARADASRLLADYERSMIINENRRTLYADITTYRSQVGTMYDRIMKMLEDGKRDEAEELFMGDEMNAAEDNLFKYLEETIAGMMGTANSVKDKNIREAGRSNTISMLLSLAAVLVGAGVGTVVIYAITKPINNLRNSIDEFSSGDLTVALNSPGKDEIAMIGDSLDKMSDSLNRVVSVVKEVGHGIFETAHDFSAVVEQTSANVNELGSSADDLGRNLENLASASEEVNAAVEEVAAGAQTTALKGTEIARKVDDAIKAGDVGMGALQNVVNGITKVADSSVSSTSAIMELGNRAKQIQSFVSQIGGIADQTNLLALNAAIEAARAGEAGRGFAVVAEEVRKLAEDSNVAAKNIAELAGTITSELDMIVEFAQSNVSESNGAKEMSSETESAIGTMIDLLRDIANSTQDLAAVAEEQAASSEEIAETVQNMVGRINDSASAGDNIRSSVTEVAMASERISTRSERLAQMAGDLEENLEFFKQAETAGTDSKRLMALSASKPNRR